MKNYRNLKIWQKGIQIVKMTYELTSKLPDSEMFNLVSQMNRSTVSIPSNIAEDSGRNSEKTLSDFYIYRWEVVLNWILNVRL